MWYNIVYQNKVESQTISTKFDPQLSLSEWRCKFGSHSQTLDEYLQPTLHDMVCMLTSGESSCTFFENKWTANDRCGNRRCVCTIFGAEGLPGCCKPMIAVTHLFSSLYQLNFFIKQLVNVREQIPKNNTKKCNVLVRDVLSATSHSSNNSLYNTNDIPGKTIMLSSCVKRTPLLWLHDKSHLRLSSLYIRTTKNIRVKWFGISLAILW